MSFRELFRELPSGVAEPPLLARHWHSPARPEFGGPVMETCGALARPGVTAGLRTVTAGRHCVQTRDRCAAADSRGRAALQHDHLSIPASGNARKTGIIQIVHLAYRRAYRTDWM